MATFEQLGVESWLSRQCAYMAMHTPTAIQRQCIPAILAGRHVAGGAATGSGKTAAFALPMLQILSEDMYGVFGLVLTASRELAYQILDQFIALGAPLRLRTMLLIGGIRHEEQLAGLQARPHVVVATPGRLLALLENYKDQVMPAMSRLRFLVLDEADRLTEGDMQADVRAILTDHLTPHPARRVLLFSATLQAALVTVRPGPPPPPPAAAAAKALKGVTPDPAADDDEAEAEEEEDWCTLLGITDAASLAVFDLAEHGTPAAAAEAGETASDEEGQDEDAKRVRASRPTTTPVARYNLPEQLQHRYLFIPSLVKLPNLVAALRARGKEQSTIVFTNSCMRAELVRLTLQLLGFPVCSLDALLTQQHRLDNLALFKLGLAKVMVCTDIAARGLDIPQVSLVLHYDFPKHAATYVHRVGRTARAGQAGLSVALVTEYDVALVQRVERQVGLKLKAWKERAVREDKVLAVLDEVSAAKVQAKQQVTDQFGNRVATRKEEAAMKRMQRQQQQQQQGKRNTRSAASDEPSRASTPAMRARATSDAATKRVRRRTGVSPTAVSERDTGAAAARATPVGRRSAGGADKPLVKRRKLT